MANLSDLDRALVRKRIMERLSQSRQSINLSKADLSFNSAIPQPARSNLTAAQKAELLAAVALRKFEV